MQNNQKGGPKVVLPKNIASIDNGKEGRVASEHQPLSVWWPGAVDPILGVLSVCREVTLVAGQQQR